MRHFGFTLSKHEAQVIMGKLRGLVGGHSVEISGLPYRDLIAAFHPDSTKNDPYFSEREQVYSAFFSSY